jgi:hypothetical protein
METTTGTIDSLRCEAPYYAARRIRDGQSTEGAIEQEAVNDLQRAYCESVACKEAVDQGE